ncbi:MAG: tRNA wybutosine-synthesizing 3 family protein [Candidatus Woesearchaeota archaeon]
MKTTFEKLKKDCLAKIDKSRKGSIDEAAMPLIDKLNQMNDYYTTSSCAGRLMLYRFSDSKKKNETEWLLQSHNPIKTEHLKEKLIGTQGDVWFMQEPSIFHVSCRTLEAAQKLMDISRAIGYKHGGIQATNNKIIVEIMGPENIVVMLVKESRLLVNDDFLEVLTEESNKKLKETQNRILKLVKQLDA